MKKVCLLKFFSMANYICVDLRIGTKVEKEGNSGVIMPNSVKWNVVTH